MRISLIARIVGLVAVWMLLLGGPGPALAKEGLLETCRKGERLAAAKAVRMVLRCHARASKRGDVLDGDCLDRARARLAKGFVKAEKRARRRGGCDAPGDEDGTWQSILDLAAELTNSLGAGEGQGSRCDAKRLSALGAEAQKLLKAKAKTRLPFDTQPLERELGQSSARVEKAFERAAKSGDCSGGDGAAEAGARVRQFAGVAGRLRGRIEAVKRIEFSPPVHADVLAQKADWEDRRFTVAEDGAWVQGVQVPAAGWLVTFGEARARTDLLGHFELDAPLGTPLSGEIFHPASDAEPIAAVSLAELAGSGDAPRPVLLQVGLTGACGMSGHAGGDPATCSELVARGSLLSRCPTGENPDPAVHPPLEEGLLGTYPDEDPPQCDCLDYDGYYPEASSEEVRYIGSTCHRQVCLGCCDNEAGDYRRLIGGFSQGVLAPLGFPRPRGCVTNHGGQRWCQQIRQADLSVEVRETIVRPELPTPQEAAAAALCFAVPTERQARGADGPHPVSVTAGESVAITVHNNGCHGRTHVIREPTAVPLGGTLTGDALTGDTITHFSGASYGYEADEIVYYEAPEDCPENLSARDVVSFETDGARATLEIRCESLVTLDVTFPSVVQEDVAAPLVALVTDTASGQPFPGLHVELDPLGGSVSPAAGPTDAQGRLEAQVTPDTGVATVEVDVEVFDDLGGDLLAEQTVSAVVSGPGRVVWASDGCSYNIGSGVGLSGPFCNGVPSAGGSAAHPLPFFDDDDSDCSASGAVGSGTGGVLIENESMFLVAPGGERIGVSFVSGGGATGELAIEGAPNPSYHAGGGATANCAATFDVVDGPVGYAATGGLSSAISGGGIVTTTVELVDLGASTAVFAIEDGEVSEGGSLAPGSYRVSLVLRAEANVSTTSGSAEATAAVLLDLLFGTGAAQP